MKLFENLKRRNHTNPVSDTVRMSELPDDLEIFNYSPGSYAYTTDFLDLYYNAEKIFEKAVDELNIDNLSEAEMEVYIRSKIDDMFDTFVKSKTDEMICSGATQFADHMGGLDRIRHRAEGAVVHAKGHLAHLRGDADEIASQIEKYTELKEKMNLH